MNFFRQYVPNYIRTWLNRLQKKQQKAFDRLKVIMAKKPEVKIFHPKKDITLTTDPSEHSISAIFSQEGHPIMYLSRRLTNTEFDYLNREKEGLNND